MKQIVQRIKEPTPKFFRKIRNIGLVLTGISTIISTATIALPVLMIKIAGYVAIAGGIASVISQTAVEDETEL